MAALEVAAEAFDKGFAEWKPEIEMTATSVKLEVAKLTSFFSHEALEQSNQAGVLRIESTSAPPSAGINTDGPSGHRDDKSFRDIRFSAVFTHIHISGKDKVVEQFVAMSTKSLMLGFRVRD